MKMYKMLKSLILVMLLAILISLLFFWIFYRSKHEERYTISVIGGQSHVQRWAILQRGLENAGNDYNVSTNFYSISNQKNVEEQISLMEREIEKKVDVIIIYAVDSEAIGKQLEQKKYHSKMILLGTDVDSEKSYPLITDHHYQIGVDIATQVIANQHKTIGILAENQNIMAYENKLQGLQEELKKEGSVNIQWIISDFEKFNENTLQEKFYSVDAIVSLDCVSTEAAALAVENYSLDTMIYGVGNSESNIYYLDKGYIEALVIPNEYNMGYFSIVTGVKMIQNKKYEKEITVNHIIVTKETLYDEENQRLVFPFVQ